MLLILRHLIAILDIYIFCISLLAILLVFDILLFLNIPQREVNTDCIHY